jgi:flagellar motor switch/type III secretory pathway protein FliN
VEETLAVRPFPWGALERIARQDVAVLRELRGLLGLLDAARLARDLGDIVGQHARLEGVRTRVAHSAPDAPDGFAIGFETDDGRVRFALVLDRDLVLGVVSTLLSRSARISDPRAPLDPVVAGAAAAVIVHLARRQGLVLRALGPGVLRTGECERRAEVVGTLTLADRAHRVRASIEWPITLAVPEVSPADRLSSLGELPLTLGVLAAVATLAREAFDTLTPGAIFLPGDGWSLSRRLEGTALLVAPGCETGIETAWSEKDGIVVRGIRALRLDQEIAMECTESSEKQSTAEVALEAPVVVHVEVGAVTLTAREWAAVGPGDVLAVGRKVGETVVLRVAGIEVARGDLVDVEGELGVKIRQLASRA